MARRPTFPDRETSLHAIHMPGLSLGSQSLRRPLPSFRPAPFVKTSRATTPRNTLQCVPKSMCTVRCFAMPFAVRSRLYRYVKHPHVRWSPPRRAAPEPTAEGWQRPLLGTTRARYHERRRPAAPQVLRSSGRSQHAGPGGGRGLPETSCLNRSIYRGPHGAGL